jgi:hypothetical protein
MRGGTHYSEDAADALFGAYSLSAVENQLYTEVDTTPNQGGQGGVFRGWSDVFCGWVVDGDDDDVSVFATESAARAWAAGTWYPDHN